MKKTRLVDIAAAAGVGLATVERVLNERGSVRPQTAEKVVLAAKRLGYKGHIPSLYRGTIRIEVILVRPESQALHRCPDIIGIYNAGGANLGVGSVLQRFQEQRGRELVWITHELNDETCHFIASGLMTLVFDQAPETQARRALDTILSRMGIIDVPVNKDPVPFLTYTVENIGLTSSHR